MSALLNQSFLDRSSLSVNTASAGGHGHTPFRIIQIGEPREMNKRDHEESVHTDHETREVQILEDKVGAG